MKCNTLSKGCSTYYKKLKTLIPVKGKYEKQFLSSIFESLEGICSEQPNISYDELCNRIGTPTDLIIEYYENADAEYVIQKLHISSIIRNIVIALLLIAVIVASIELYSFINYINKLKTRLMDIPLNIFKKKHLNNLERGFYL